MAGGGVASPTDALEHVQYSAEEIRAITSVAGNVETYAKAHAYTPVSIRHAVRSWYRAWKSDRCRNSATSGRA